MWSEQGLGDTIQFVRYVPRVKALGATVVVECPALLTKPSSATLPGDRRAGDRKEESRLAYDCQIPMMSLPGALRDEPRTRSPGTART